jgi:hypothetical protein
MGRFNEKIAVVVPAILTLEKIIVKEQHFVWYLPRK